MASPVGTSRSVGTGNEHSLVSAGATFNEYWPLYKSSYLASISSIVPVVSPNEVTIPSSHIIKGQGRKPTACSIPSDVSSPGALSTSVALLPPLDEHRTA
jgi:hypothetical protein